MIYSALNLLIAQDNILSQLDKSQAKFLVGKPYDDVSQEETYQAYQMLGRYVPQLKVLGIDYFSIPEPALELKEQPEDYKGTISLSKSRLYIKSEYDYFLIEIIKKFKGAKYNGKDRSWSLPLNNRTKCFVYNLVENDNFYYGKEVTDIIKEVRDKYKRISKVNISLLEELVDATGEYLDHETKDFITAMEYRAKLIDTLERARKEIEDDKV